MMEQYNEGGKKFGRTAVRTGVSFGSVLAIVISFHTRGSVWLAILHGILNWFYVIYYMIFG